MSEARTSCWTANGVIRTSDCNICAEKTNSDDSFVRITNPQYTTDLWQGLSEQRTKGRFLDCFIELESETIAVHKFLVQSFSDYIATLLQYQDHPLLKPRDHVTNQAIKPRDHVTNQAIKRRNLVDLKWLDSAAVKMLMDCPYRSYLAIPSEDTIHLRIAADFLMVPGVHMAKTIKRVLLFERDDFQSKLLKDLGDRRRGEETIDVGSLRVSAHRCILAIFSEYFDSDDKWENLNVDDTFQTLHPASVEMLVNYAYTGVIVIKSCAVLDAVRVAECLGFKGVVEMLYEHLYGCLTVENCLIMHEQAKGADNGTIQEDVKRYILQHFKEVSDTEEFLNLDVDTLMEFLEHDELTMMVKYRYDERTNKYYFMPPDHQECGILNMILRYARHNLSADMKFEDLPRMLARGVRLPLIETLSVSMLPISLVGPTTFETCRGIILSAKKYSQQNSTGRLRSMDTYWPNWTVPRRTSRLRFGSIRISRTDLHPVSNRFKKFDDSKAFDLPVQYVTGMKLYVRYYEGEALVSGMQVTYNYVETVLHGTQEHDAQCSFKLLQSFERIIDMQFSTWKNNTHLLNGLRCITNDGRYYGYEYRFSENAVCKPEGALYLAYVTSGEDFFRGKLSVRDLEFVWAMDISSRK